jgi:acetyl-CoA C-acetyltransferase
MSLPPPAPAYIIAARRSALGRVGGLHRQRRLEDLAVPVIVAVLKDAGFAPARVDELVVGNTTHGGNPARLLALASGLPETMPALTIDRQCSSGLDAILHAVRSIAAGDAEVVVAGGAESLSTAPWRIARPRSLYQTPHFILPEAPGENGHDFGHVWEASERLARRHSLSRMAQDAFAFKSHIKAEQAREQHRFVGEIVPLRANAEEARDQSATAPRMEDLELEEPFEPPSGTVTPATISQPHDGAAMVVVVAERVWQELRRPPALRLVSAAARGVPPAAEAEAPIAAMQKLLGRLNGIDRSQIRSLEISEASAAQALAMAHELGFDEDLVNPHGGAIVRGHASAASGAVLVVRLFTELVRGAPAPRQGYGAAAQGSLGGLGLAAMFEAV